MRKFVILTDSIGNPRPFPASEPTNLEETYPYIIRNYFQGSLFWQLSYGDVTTDQLVSETLNAIVNWDPDFIIVQAGINGARPEAFSEFEKSIIRRITGRFFSGIKQYIYHPAFIRNRQISRIKNDEFRRYAEALRSVFERSCIFWLEVCSHDNYERVRPGVLKRSGEFNEILEQIYGEHHLKIKEAVLNADGFMEDHLHWNKRGHEVVAGIILDNILARISNAK